MKRVALMALACLPALAADGSDWKNWQYHDQESVQRSFDVPGAGRKLSVNNIHGFIHVTGYDGSQIKVSVQNTSTAARRMHCARPNRSSRSRCRRKAMR